MTEATLEERRGVTTVAEIPLQPARIPGLAKRRRVAGVDAARGVALLGMMAVHSLYVVDESGEPTWTATIFSGRAAAVFAVLAGVGVAFLTGRHQVRLSEGPAIVAALVNRALVIGAIGLGLGYTDASLGAVILPYYAVMFILVIPLVFLPTWALVGFGVAAAGGMPVLSHLLRPGLPDPSLENPTLGYLVDHPAGLLTELLLTGYYPALPWLTYLCAGIVVGRLDLTRPKVAALLLGVGTALTVAASITSSVLLGWYGGLEQIRAAGADSGLTEAETSELLTFGSGGTTPTSTWWWLAVDGPHTSTPLDLAETTGTAVALLGVMLLAGHLTRLRALITLVQTPLAAVGTMTLTFYTAHIMFINSRWDIYGVTTGYLIQVVVVLLVGLAWRATAVRGPLEALVSVLTTHAREQWTRHIDPSSGSFGRTLTRRLRSHGRPSPVG